MDKYSYSSKDYGTVEAGARLDHVPLYQDVLRDDGEVQPPTLAERGNYDAKPRLITYDRYIDPRFVPLEIERIWKKQWQIACREEDIPNVGDRISYDVATLSYVVVRSGPDEFRAFHNSCRHRGRKICDKKGSGPHFRCAFHGWVYGLDGKLEWMPIEQEFPHVTAESFSLHEVKVARWGGNVFINPDPDAPPFEDTLGPLKRHMADYDTGDRYTAMHVRKKVRCNWKAAQEAFDEAYHAIETHSDGLAMYGTPLTQIDVWEEPLVHLSRLVVPGMVIDPYITDRLTTHEALNFFCSAFGFEPPPADRGHSQADARQYAAECKRKQLEETTGLDFSGRTAGYFLDMNKYHFFPNFHPWWGEMYPWWYRFLPVGDNPDHSTMEIRVLLPIPKGEKAPPPIDVVEVDFDEHCDDFPELGPLGHIAEQDMRNMVAVQQGFKAAAAGENFLTLATNAEGQIRHFHEVYDRIMDLTQQ